MFLFQPSANQSRASIFARIDSDLNVLNILVCIALLRSARLFNTYNYVWAFNPKDHMAFTKGSNFQVADIDRCSVYVLAIYIYIFTYVTIYTISVLYLFMS